MFCFVFLISIPEFSSFLLGNSILLIFFGGGAIFFLFKTLCMTTLGVQFQHQCHPRCQALCTHDPRVHAKPGCHGIPIFLSLTSSSLGLRVLGEPYEINTGNRTRVCRVQRKRPTPCCANAPVPKFRNLSFLAGHPKTVSSGLSSLCIFLFIYFGAIPRISGSGHYGSGIPPKFRLPG